MPLVVIPATEAFAYVDTTSSPIDRAMGLTATERLGFGLIRPFRRDQKNDFASRGGVELVKACVGQILSMRGASPTTPGELEWDPERGSLLYLLRHKGNGEVLQQMARVYVRDTLQRYEPRIVLRGMRATREPNPLDGEPDAVLLLRIVYDVLAAPRPNNLVLFSNVDQTVTLPKAA